jgi:CAAX protease family protein
MTCDLNRILGTERVINSFFWNTAERRLRAAWRLILQFAVFFAVLLTFASILKSKAGDRITLPRALTAGAFYLSSGLVAGWLMARFIDRRPFADFGFHLSRSWWLDFGFGLLLGAIMITTIFLVEWLAGCRCGHRRIVGHWVKPPWC